MLGSSRVLGSLTPLDVFVGVTTLGVAEDGVPEAAEKVVPARAQMTRRVSELQKGGRMQRDGVLASLSGAWHGGVHFRVQDIAHIFLVRTCM